MTRFLPEWAPQWGVMIAWPHADTDWAPILSAAEDCYCALAGAILARESLLVLCRDETHGEHIREKLRAQRCDLARLHLRVCPYNDTWARDFGPLAITQDAALKLLDFTFNGWGGKFDASLDNAVNKTLDWGVPCESVPLVLEGGSVESDGNGRILTTSQCLLNPNRNARLDRAQVEESLHAAFGSHTILWLEHGHLEGDDTDAHVDTLARFCDADTVAYVSCADSNDSHYEALQAMERELQTLARQHNLKLVPLPMAEPCFDTDGVRLPATYANFLIVNGAVLVPAYECASDSLALKQMTEAFPQHEVIGVPCLPLIQQHGSLHCVTMQLPEGVFGASGE